MTETPSRQVRIVSRWGSSRVLFTFNAPEGLESGLWLRTALEAAAESGAVLTGAVLTGAVLTGAVLTGADLTGAVLTGADLTGAVLTGAVLTGADLTGAVLTGAVLTGAVLTGAVLTSIKADFFDVLLRAPREIPALRAALVAGKVDGSCYEGACACLVGTIANARGAQYNNLGAGLAPNSSRPIESFFMNIRPGNTPQTHQVPALCVEWLDEFVVLMQAAASAFVEVQP